MDYNQGGGAPGRQQQPPGGAGFPQYKSGMDQYPGMPHPGGHIPPQQQMYGQQQRPQQPSYMMGPGAGGFGQPLSQQVPPQPVMNPPTQAPFPSGPSTVQQPQVVASTRAAETARRTVAAQAVQNTFPQEYLGDLSRYSVGALAIVGKELVSELNIKKGQLWSILPPSKHHLQDPSELIDYMNTLFSQLAQVRVLIDQKTTGREMSIQDIFRDLQDMSDPVETRPSELLERERVFLENRKKLSDLSCDLKLLDWTASVSDPGQLKKVDKMQTARDTTHNI